MTKAKLYFLHGVGGPKKPDKWRKTLSRTLRQHGLPDLAKSDVHLINYRPALHDDGRPKLKPVSTSQNARDTARGPYEDRLDELEQALRPSANRRKKRRPTVDQLPPKSRKGLAILVRMAPRFRDAELYRKDKVARKRVLAHVLKELPTEPYVLVAHSLGSQVAADLLRYLPASSPLILLVTLGSPLSVEGTMKGTMGRLETFPYDRLGAWVNIHSWWDPVTGGHGLSRRKLPVVDIPIRTRLGRGWKQRLGEPMKHHGRSAYFSHEATATAVAYGMRLVTPATDL